MSTAKSYVNHTGVTQVFPLPNGDSIYVASGEGAAGEFFAQFALPGGPLKETTQSDLQIRATVGDVYAEAIAARLAQDAQLAARVNTAKTNIEANVEAKKLGRPPKV